MAYKKTIKQCEFCGKDFLGGKRTTCSQRCSSAIYWNSKADTATLYPCRGCDTKKEFKSFYTHRNRPVALCKSCYDRRYEYRLKNFMILEREFAKLHRLLKRVKNRDWNVTDYDEWEMLLLHGHFFPRATPQFMVNEKKASEMWIKMAFYYRDIKEKVIFNE